MFPPPFLDIDLRYCWGEPKKPSEEISYFSVEQSISISQYITHTAIPAIQTTNDGIATHCECAPQQVSGTIYRLLDLMGIAHDIWWAWEQIRCSYCIRSMRRPCHTDWMYRFSSLLEGINSLMDFATLLTSNYVQVHDIKCTDVAAQILVAATNWH